MRIWMKYFDFYYRHAIFEIPRNTNPTIKIVSMIVIAKFSLAVS